MDSFGSVCRYGKTGGEGIDVNARFFCGCNGKRLKRSQWPHCKLQRQQPSEGGSLWWSVGQGGGERGTAGLGNVKLFFRIKSG